MNKQRRLILDFDEWLSKNCPSLTFMLISEVHIRAHLTDLSSCFSMSRVRDSYYTLRRFYDWLKYKRLIVFNPVPDIVLPRQNLRLVVADNEDVKKLFSYICNPDTHPEDAFVLALILVFGFTTDDLMHATVDFSKGLVIHLRRREISYGRHYYNRNDTFIPPDSPLWWTGLIKRFTCHWQKAYSRVKKTYPNYPLILPLSGVHARPVHQSTLIKRFYKATVAATGKRIPIKVLRQTCGHLYSRDGDASLLAILGWSPAFAFYYTWLPRMLFSESAPPDKNQL